MTHKHEIANDKRLTIEVKLEPKLVEVAESKEHGQGPQRDPRHYDHNSAQLDAQLLGSPLAINSRIRKTINTKKQ